MLFSRLAVSCPLRSTLSISNGGARSALRGKGAAAGLFELPLKLPLTCPLLLLPLAGEARMPELDIAAAVSEDVGT